MPEYTTGKFDRENLRLQKIILDLRAILRPAVEAARERQDNIKKMSSYHKDHILNKIFLSNDKALLAAGEILGIESEGQP